jgi:uncharacterized protein
MVIGTVASLWRYPVKSMLGEELDSAEVTAYGLVGDRSYALIDVDSGRVVSAKHPRKWPALLACHARYLEPPVAGAALPPLHITLPDGTGVTSEQRDVDRVLSKALGREVTLTTQSPDDPVIERYWPEIHGRGPQSYIAANRVPTEDPGEIVTTGQLAILAPSGTFFDACVLHLVTTASLEYLHERYPQGRFGVRRFRPNIVVRSSAGQPGLAENAWIDHLLTIGHDVWLRVVIPVPRCVVTTLAQLDLPKDAGILRTIARYNQVDIPGYDTLPCFGVYADPLRTGIVHRGDEVRLH